MFRLRFVVTEDDKTSSPSINIFLDMNDNPRVAGDDNVQVADKVYSLVLVFKFSLEGIAAGKSFKS